MEKPWRWTKIKEEIKVKIKENGEKCELCGKEIKKRSLIIFSNICHNPNNHYFCSKECKIEYITTLRASKEEKIII